MGRQLEILSRVVSGGASWRRQILSKLGWSKGMISAGVCGKSAAEREAGQRPYGLLKGSALLKEQQE